MYDVDEALSTEGMQVGMNNNKMPHGDICIDGTM